MKSPDDAKRGAANHDASQTLYTRNSFRGMDHRLASHNIVRSRYGRIFKPSATLP